MIRGVSVHAEQGFSPSALVTFGAGQFFVWGLSVQCRMFRSVPGLYSVPRWVPVAPLALLRCADQKRPGHC